MDLAHALTIAGSDSGGGAGIQADLKTFSALGVYGASVITAVTVQNTQAVLGVQDIDPKIVTAQIDAVMSDIRIDAVKIGMLSSSDIIFAVSDQLKKWEPKAVVLDPVMMSKSGCKLLKDEAIVALRDSLLPLASLLTPNVPEAELLTGIQVDTREDMEKAGKKLLAMGAAAALVKGGHCAGHSDDLLVTRDGLQWIPGERINVRNTHGTGCTLSSAITALLAKGEDLSNACVKAKDYVRRAMDARLEIGKGCGPLHHFVDWYPKD